MHASAWRGPGSAYTQRQGTTGRDHAADATRELSGTTAYKSRTERRAEMKPPTFAQLLRAAVDDTEHLVRAVA